MSSKWNIKRDFTKHHQLSLLQNKRGIIKKAAITAVLLSSVTFNLAFANESDNIESLDKIYHVYVGDKYIGAVSDEKAINKIIKTKENEASNQFKGFSVDANSSISLIPEQVFSHETNDAETLDKLNKELVVQADAFAFKVDGKAVTYVKDVKDYEETIRQLKLQYVTEQQLNQLDINKRSSKELPKLKRDEERIVSIEIKEELSGETAKVHPSKILTPKEAVKFLKTGSLEKDLYTVKEGDVLGKIAHTHNLKVAELLDLNPGLKEDSVLQIGQKVNVTVEKPLVNIEIVLEKANVEKIDYANIVQEDEKMFKGDKEVKQEGAYGKKEVSYLIKEVNGQRAEKTVTDENVLSEPENRVVVIGTKVTPSRGSGNFSWPTVGGYISSQMGARWGEFHRGIDIARPSNYTIKAADNGEVTFTGWDGTYGNKIVINHNNGYETVYAHLSQIDVSVGQVVPQGSAIAVMGSTGNSTGIHLHFEVHKNGSLVNPLSVLN